MYTCLDCKNYVPKDSKVIGTKEVIKGVLEPISVDIPSHCTKHNDVMLAWFEKYKEVPMSQLKEEDQLSCIELREHMKCLNKAIDLTQKIIDELDKSSK